MRFPSFDYQRTRSSTFHIFHNRQPLLDQVRILNLLLLLLSVVILYVAVAVDAVIVVVVVVIVVVVFFAFDGVVVGFTWL